MKPLVPFLKSRLSNNSPQLILVLGGEVDREIIGIKFAKELKMPLLISGGSNPEYSDWLIQKEGISTALVKRDYRAKDTLTNFTSIVDDLADENINHILLITSEYHINRAKIVGEIITGSRGIRLTSLSIPCTAFCQHESQRKKNIDIIRAIAWVATGKDFKELMPKIIKNQLGE
ncbi:MULTISPECIES: YdcF family protein [Prochlorococcus]|nr:MULTISPECIES: YdcF family protein [Prochlorococcus]KGG18521.1 hypothetical protein EV08_1768 [Prochlorococcus marinus str. SS2]KGG22794.1 hypothetical protein EV09_1535 [Prochlorococcus marinus str. SS35]KGG11525.1 hypothetical protein EV04_1050 [Prochlorococcus marinus str. LG]KGG32671.1 hypothetical protein EV10_0988 [Prochlorococcus marinus str. SS51]KGG35381.1 hypothetical protein EV11_1329 [Prochlorococcus sp. SS52]